MNRNHRYAGIIIALTLLFCFRVCAQLIQKFYPLDILPAFDQWQSGVMPYPVLVAFQIAILVFLLIHILKLSQGNIAQNYRRGRFCLIAGSIYFLLMLFRLVMGLGFAPEHHWFGAIIPTIFHLVLASILLTMWKYHGITKTA